MTIKELIEELKKRNPDENVTVWDAMSDCETAEIYLSETSLGTLISSVKD